MNPTPKIVHMMAKDAQGNILRATRDVATTDLLTTLENWGRHFLEQEKLAFSVAMRPASKLSILIEFDHKEK
jgi:hypothetical protein